MPINNLSNFIEGGGREAFMSSGKVGFSSKQRLEGILANEVFAEETAPRIGVSPESPAEGQELERI